MVVFGRCCAAKMGWSCVDGGRREAEGTQEIGLHVETRPNGMGRRLQGGTDGRPPSGVG